MEHTHPLDIDILTNLSADHGLNNYELYQLAVESPEFKLPWGGFEKAVRSKRPLYSYAWLSRRCSSESESETSETKPEELEVTDVSGSDVAGEIPTNYQIIGLKGNELVVVGTLVDKNIIPGFKYRVRPLPQKSCFFSGESKTLKSVGPGYGKRITFEGNNNFFYSDNHPGGYGFSIDVLSLGECFDLHSNSGRKVGEVTITVVSNFQKEIQIEKGSNGHVLKHVVVSFRCRVNYCKDAFGLIPRCTTEMLQLTGVAEVERKGRHCCAKTVSIKNVVLPDIGPCLLYS